MSSDGHAYIGKLSLPDGTCVDVSLPESTSRRLAGQPPHQTTVVGRVLPYIYEDSIIDYKVNGRLIGYGKCGKFFLFVK